MSTFLSDLRKRSCLHSFHNVTGLLVTDDLVFIPADSEQADMARMLYKDTCHEVLYLRVNHCCGLCGCLESVLLLRFLLNN